MRYSVCKWKTGCCGIFCNSQEGSESNCKISRDLLSQNRVSVVHYVSFFWSIRECGYYRFVKRMNRAEKDTELAEKIRKQQSKCFQTYGYRKMWQWLKSQNIYRNPKTVLWIMKKYDLLSKIRCYRKWRQMGQQAHRYENLLNRQFYAQRPNSKWLTDIFYIHTKQGALYLSMIRDLHDNSIVAYKTGSQQTGQSGIGYHTYGDKVGKKRVTAQLQLHSDQGFQYTSQAYFRFTQQYGITHSMSRHRNLYDNAMAKIFSLFLRRSVSIVINRLPSAKPTK